MAGLWAKKACEAAKFIGNIELILRFWAKSGANKMEQQPDLLIFSQSPDPIPIFFKRTFYFFMKDMPRLCWYTN